MRFRKESIPLRIGLPLMCVAANGWGMGACDCIEQCLREKEKTREGQSSVQCVGITALAPTLAAVALARPAVTQLDSLGILNNTYIMYSSDNGYHLGNHALSKVSAHSPSAEETHARQKLILATSALAKERACSPAAAACAGPTSPL